MIFALVGNQNCGKTTLFNQLTGSNQHVGNFPGVTVDQKVGEIRREKGSQVVDLPGIYSIRPYTAEEIVTRDFILNSKPDGIINIVDATNIERNLYLSIQLMGMQIPMVLALNMMDEVSNNGGTIDIAAMSQALGIPVVPISALKGQGVDELVDKAMEVARGRILPRRIDFCEQGAVHRCIHAVCHQIEDHAEAAGLPLRFSATKLIENDDVIRERLKLQPNELELLEHSILQMEEERGLDRFAALADMRYEFIERLCARTVVKPQQSKERQRSVRIDNLLTNKYLAIPMFLLIIFSIFYLSFDVIGLFLQELLEGGIGLLQGFVDTVLVDYGLNPIVRSLVVDAILGGVGGMISFLPVIATLFFFLSILEDTGYMARVAFVMDTLLRKIGLSGRSIVPMLIGFGCSVPAIMATRTLSSERDRKMTILLTPFMSCSAKIPIYGFFAAAFFPEHAGLVMIGLYLLGIVMAILMALIMKNTAFRGNPVPFVMELPNYRFPSLKSVGLLVWDKVKDFLQRACSVIFLATVIVWFLESFDARLNPVSDNSLSLLAVAGQYLTPLFAPLGLGDWRLVASLFTGFIAKESVVTSLSVLIQGTGIAAVLPTAGQAMSFLVFCLLYTPCVAAISVVKRELGSPWAAAGVALMQCVVAWVVAWVVFAYAQLFSAMGALNLLILTAVALWGVFALAALIGRKRAGKSLSCGGNCDGCSAACSKRDTVHK